MSIKAEAKLLIFSPRVLRHVGHVSRASRHVIHRMCPAGQEGTGPVRGVMRHTGHSKCEDRSFSNLCRSSTLFWLLDFFPKVKIGFDAMAIVQSDNADLKDLCTTCICLFNRLRNKESVFWRLKLVSLFWLRLWRGRSEFPTGVPTYSDYKVKIYIKYIICQQGWLRINNECLLSCKVSSLSVWCPFNGTSYDVLSFI